MDKITQTIFETILVKLEKIEKYMINNTFKKDSSISAESSRKPGIRYASVEQIKFAKRLGGDPWEDITHEEVGKMIDSLKDKPKSIEDRKESPEIEKAIAKSSKSESPETSKDEFPDY